MFIIYRNNINETGELSLFYEDKKVRKCEDVLLIFLNVISISCRRQIYSASDGKIREYMGYEDAASYDAFRSCREDTVESGRISELAQKSIR